MSKSTELGYALEAGEMELMKRVVGALMARVSWRAKEVTRGREGAGRLTMLEAYYQSPMGSTFEMAEGSLVLGKIAIPEGLGFVLA